MGKQHAGFSYSLSPGTTYFYYILSIHKPESFVPNPNLSVFVPKLNKL